MVCFACLSGLCSSWPRTRRARVIRVTTGTSRTSLGQGTIPLNGILTHTMDCDTNVTTNHALDITDCNRIVKVNDQHIPISEPANSNSCEFKFEICEAKFGFDICEAKFGLEICEPK